MAISVAFFQGTGKPPGIEVLWEWSWDVRQYQNRYRYNAR
jgi:hypothetical protein